MKKINDIERLQLYREYFNFPNPNNFRKFNYKKMASELSQISVKLTTLDVTVTSEVPEYSISQLLSDIGGQLGLWIGMSAITVFEMIEVLLNLAKAF